MIQNPVLKGFNPDPSICRVGEDYYIATSTFEWFPGVQIHHSRDLENWELIKRPLERLSQLNMLGNDDSCGIWAPCLTHADGKFWLVYTDVKTTIGPFKDSPNYIVTCDTIDGDWSDPIYINSSGFDPSLFHDDDGKKYFVNMIWDHRVPAEASGKPRFYGIILQEFDYRSGELIGDSKLIYEGTAIGLTEGPHIYKKDGYYYLAVAEGGTVYEHAESIVRSKNIWGEYESHPDNPMITAYLSPDNYLQKTGHGDLVETQDGEWYFAHLCGRPLDENNSLYGGTRGSCPLGRETSIQKVEWIDGWPYIVGGKAASQYVLSLNGNDEIKDEKKIQHIEEFDNNEWGIDFQTLRVPLLEGQFSLTERESHLRLYGMQSLSSRFHKSMLARRWQSLNFESEIKVEFNPISFQQSAGLTNYYNCDNLTACGISHHEEYGRVLEIFEIDATRYHNIIYIPLESEGSVQIKSVVDGNKYHYEYNDGTGYKVIEHYFSSAKLSDDYILQQKDAFFTGAFIGMYCYDLTGMKKYADFDVFKYLEK